MIVRTALFLSILSISTVFATFKDGHEYVYSYTGEVEIGTTKPAEYYTYSDVIADLHVKPVKGDLQIWIKNVRYLTYSGSAKRDVDDATKEVPMPNESESLTIPFVYHRYTNDTESGISTSQEDELWSIKMKQAIASLLYVNEEGLKPPYCHMSEFTLCSVIQNGDNLQILATESDTFDPGYERESIPDGYPTIRRTFDLKKESEGFTLQKVTSLSSHRGYQGLEVFYIYVNQTIELKDNNSSDLKEIDTSSLTYHDVEKDSVLRKNKKTSNNLPEEDSNDILVLKKKLENIYNDLNNLQPPTRRSLDQQNELKEMLTGLEGLNVDQLNNLYNSVSDDPYLHDLMLDTALLTNSPKAYCLITKLIENQKFTDVESMNLLTKMSENPIPLTECLEKDLLKLAYDEQSPMKKIRYQAVITLASMIRVSPDQDKYEHIVKGFIKNLQDSKHESEQAIYVYALQNADTFKSRIELIDIAQGLDEEYKDLSGHIRALAANCIKYEQFRGFLIQYLIDNGKQDFEVRATALNVLLDSIDKQQSSEIISNLLLNPDDDELYQLLYARLQSISKMTSRNKAKAVEAAKILQLLTKPTETPKTATSQVIDYTDEFSGRGLTIEITTYGNMVEKKFITCHLKLNIKDLYWNEFSYEWYIHLTNGRRETAFIDILESLNKMDAVREVILKKNGFVVSIEPVDLKRLMAEIFQNKLKINNVSASQLKNIQTIIPTDMGTSVVFSDQMICLNKVDLEFYISVNREEGQFNFDGKRRCVNYLGLSAYNPVANMWHGAKSVVDADANLPFNMYLKTDYQSSPALRGTLTSYRSKTPFGVQTTSLSYIYMKGEEDVEAGKVSCPKCDVRNVVTNGENHRENMVLVEDYIEDVGLEYKLSVFDCEEHVTLASLKSFKPRMPSAMCGISLVIGNKEENPVTQTELAYNIDADRSSLSEDLISLTEYILQFNYSVKNDDKVMKTYEISYDCIVYAYNRSECEINVVSKKEGVTYHTIHSDNSLTYNHDDVYSTWKILSGDVVDGKQSDDSTSVMIQYTATNKNEINSKINPEKLLEECDENTDIKFSDCMRDISAFRLNIFNISYSNLKPKHMWLWAKVSDFFRSKYAEKFKRLNKYNIAENCAEIRVTHPVYRDSIDVSVTTPHEAYEYDDLPLDNVFSSLIVKPYSGLNVDTADMNGYCEVGSDYVVKHNYDREELKYEKDWTDMASYYDYETGKSIWSIDAKKMNEDSDDLAMRFKIGEDVIEVAHTEDFEIKLNDNVLKPETNKLTRVSNMLDVMTLSRDGKTKRVIVHAVPKIINIECTRNRIRISLPYHPKGKCRT